jgi:hypothetical protein
VKLTARNATTIDADTAIAKPINALIIVFLACVVCSGEPWLVINKIAPYSTKPTAARLASLNSISMTAATISQTSDKLVKAGEQVLPLALAPLGKYSYQVGNISNNLGPAQELANTVNKLFII